MIEPVKKLWFWVLDYIYVFKWQLRGLAARRSKADYVRRDVDAPVAVIIPGIYETWYFMRPVAELLYQKGYSVHVIEKLGYNLGDVPLMANIVADYIDAFELSDVTLIAHSKGGLIGKYLLAHYNHQSRCKALIAINTPFAGSVYAYLVPMPSVRRLSPRSKELVALQVNKEVNHCITSLYSTFDPHVPGKSYLDGAVNVELPVYGHFRIMSDRHLHSAIIKALAQ